MKSKMNSFATSLFNKKATVKDSMQDMLCTPMKGATAMEYVLIVSIMAGVIIIAWRLLGRTMTDRMNEVDGEIRRGF